MEKDHTIESNIPTTNMMNEKKEEPINASQNQHSTNRPTTLNTVTSNITVHENVHRYNINNIHLTPSPMNTQPRIFQRGAIIESDTFERIQTSVYNKPKRTIIEEEEEDEETYDEGNSDHEQGLDETLNNARDEEIQQLSQLILTQQPINDSTAQLIINQLNIALDSTKAITNINVNANNDSQQQQVITTTQHSYPPMNQTGPVDDHDRPYAEYGHLTRHTIAQECQFDLQPSPPFINQPSTRLHAKSFAITSMTNVSKALVMKKIKDEFGIGNIQYICISEEISELNHRQHLHIQIIFKETIDRRKPFLDEITQTHCNYQVTKNDLAWNEYIKKGGNCIEFNEFKSTTTRGPKQWPSPSPTPSRSDSRSSVVSTPAAAAAASPVSTTTFDHRNQPVVPRATSVKGQTIERRQHQLETYEQAVKLARTNVDHAMDLIKREMIDKFVEHGTWYLTIFNYVHLREQREMDRRGDIDKDYVWPNSFPNCTPQLRDAVNRWIKEEFSRRSRAKCLILIGDTGTGKTSFAMSLPGRVNYFQERWNLDAWNNYARYSVYDDIPWDDFSKFGFPNKKNLLTQKRYKISATDKYRGAKEINVRQPAIVLLNAEDAGSLLEEPITDRQKKTAEYWKQRAFIYTMGPNEYFYTRQHQATTNVDSSQLSSGNEEPIAEPDEFEKMIQRYEQKHQK